MKFVYSSFLGFTILIISFGCKKDSGGYKKDSGDSNKSIVGKWELRQTSAALNPDVSNYAPGNGFLLLFDGSNYEFHANGNITKKGQYSIVTVNDTVVENSVCLVFPKGQYNNRIIYDNDTTSVKRFFQVTGNQLIFYSGCYAYDAGTNQIYERVGD